MVTSSGGKRGGRTRRARKGDTAVAVTLSSSSPPPPPEPIPPSLLLHEGADIHDAPPPPVCVAIPAEAAPYLIGIGGRNVSLIGKHTGAFVHVDGERVTLSRREGATSYDLDLARRMALGMASGAVLKWFSTPSATATHAPEALVETLCEQCTAEFGCALRLLRARTGHMCLTLVPLTDESVARVPAARVAALGRIACA